MLDYILKTGHTQEKVTHRIKKAAPLLFRTKAETACRDHLEPMCRAGLRFDNVRTVSLKNVRVEGCEGEAVAAAHVETLTQESVQVRTTQI